MNHPKGNLSADWRLKWPEPEKLLGRTARHVSTREFHRITMVTTVGDVELVKDYGTAHPVTHMTTLEQLATNYNIVPEDRL